MFDVFRQYNFNLAFLQLYLFVKPKAKAIFFEMIYINFVNFSIKFGLFCNAAASFLGFPTVVFIKLRGLVTHNTALSSNYENWRF